MRFFLRVAELGSVTRAAAVLHIAQPALSRQIRALEEELDVTLFHRSDRGIALTEAGKSLQESAVGLLRHFERVRTELRDHKVDPSGELTIAMPPSMADLLTFPVVQRFRSEYPKVLLRVFDGISGVLDSWAMVRQGKADLAVVASIEPLASLEVLPFMQEPMCLVGPVGAGLELGSPVDLDALAGKPMVALSRPNVARMMVESAIAEKGLSPQVILEMNTRQMVLSAVEAGMGFAALPFCSGYDLLQRERISMAPLRGLLISWVLIKDREQVLSAAGERMQSMLFDIAREQIESQRWQFATLLP